MCVLCWPLGGRVGQISEKAKWKKGGGGCIALKEQPHRAYSGSGLILGNSLHLEFTVERQRSQDLCACSLEPSVGLDPIALGP